MNHDRPAAPRSGLRLLDLGALVVGYSLAALGLRAFWPRGTAASAAVYAVAVVTYAWLGLALSGPFVLLLHRTRRPGTLGKSRYTGAETAWLLVGGYWLSFLLLSVPVHVVPPTYGLLPILAGLLAWVLAPRQKAGLEPASLWTHRTAVVVLVTWPLAWVGMILMTSALY